MTKMTRRQAISTGAAVVGASVAGSLAAATPAVAAPSGRVRARELGVAPGDLPTGELNSITDVDGVTVGQVTLIDGDHIRTGVTAIVPHQGNVFQDKVPGGVFIGNAFGKLAGSTQVSELGTIETPIVLTNTLSVARGIDGTVKWTLDQPGNQSVRSVNALVGETNDGALNDIRGRHVTEDHVIDAIESAGSGLVEEGSVGAGTGTTCFGWKGGIGTSSRIVGGYTVGVLVQTNYGGSLRIDGVPIGEELDPADISATDTSGDGSCMLVVATDAPLTSRNLERLAARSLFAMATTGSSFTNGSGDFAIAFSTSPDVREPAGSAVRDARFLPNAGTSPLFRAALHATEEAIYNSMFMATTITGDGGTTRHAIPLKDVRRLLRKYGRGRG
jgi:D-aminopeptidase